MTDISEAKPELLVLVKDRPEAMRLIVTWPKAWEEYKELEFTGLVVRPEFQVDDPFTVAWSKISDVDIDYIAELTPVLFLNRLIEPEGVVPDWVVGFVRKMMLDAVNK